MDEISPRGVIPVFAPSKRVFGNITPEGEEPLFVPDHLIIKAGLPFEILISGGPDPTAASGFEKT
jgi:hypothetical protein